MSTLSLYTVRRNAWFGLVVAGTIAAWAMALRGGFQYDDFENVVNDGATLHPGAIFWRLFHGVRPLLRASYALDYAIWGRNPFGFLLTNLVLHVATTLGVLALGRRLTGERSPGAAVAALLFALQPAAGEVVAYVSGRSTGLMTALLVWGLVAHAGAGPFASLRRSRRAAVALTLFAAACLAKEVGLIFPLLVAVWDRSVAPGAVRPRILAVTAAAALGLCALSAHYRGLLAYSLDLRDPAASLLVNLRALPELLALLVRPDLLSIVQPFDPGAHDAAGLALGSAIVVALLATALLPRGRAPLAALSAGWLLVALLPTQSLIAKTEVVTAKPLYLAWIGVALAAGGVAARWLAAVGLRARLAEPAAAIILCAAAAASAHEARVWSDDVALWTRAVERAPDDAVAWNDLGDALRGRGRCREAFAAFARAIRIDPTDVALRDHENLARLECGVPCTESPCTDSP